MNFPIRVYSDMLQEVGQEHSIFPNLLYHTISSGKKHALICCHHKLMTHAIFKDGELGKKWRGEVEPNLKWALGNCSVVKFTCTSQSPPKGNKAVTNTWNIVPELMFEGYGGKPGYKYLNNAVIKEDIKKEGRMVENTFLLNMIFGVNFLEANCTGTNDSGVFAQPETVYILYFIRHAASWHNFHYIKDLICTGISGPNRKDFGCNMHKAGKTFNAPSREKATPKKIGDSPLINKGFFEAAECGRAVNEMRHYEDTGEERIEQKISPENTIVLCSPLKRCILTICLILLQMTAFIADADVLRAIIINIILAYGDYTLHLQNLLKEDALSELNLWKTINVNDVSSWESSNTFFQAKLTGQSKQLTFQFDILPYLREFGDKGPAGKFYGSDGMSGASYGTGCMEIGGSRNNCITIYEKCDNNCVKGGWWQSGAVNRKIVDGPRCWRGVEMRVARWRRQGRASWKKYAESLFPDSSVVIGGGLLPVVRAAAEEVVPSPSENALFPLGLAAAVAEQPGNTNRNNLSAAEESNNNSGSAYDWPDKPDGRPGAPNNSSAGGRKTKRHNKKKKTKRHNKKKKTKHHNKKKKTKHHNKKKKTRYYKRS